MTAPEELLQKLERLDIRLIVKNDNLLEYDAPDDTMTPELRDQMRMQKSALIQHLRPDGKATLPVVDSTDLEELAISDLLARQPVVRVRSHILGTIVVWAADNALIAADVDEVIYRETELRQLQGLSPAELRAVHMAKTNLDGEVI